MKYTVLMRPAIMLAVCIIAGWCNGATLGRPIAVTRMQAQVTLSPQLAASADQREKVLEAVRAEIARSATTFLPAELIVPSERGLATIVDRALLVRFADAEYMRVLVEQRMSEVKGQIAYQAMFPPPDPQQEELLRRTVLRVIEGMHISMERHLKGPRPLYTQEEIAQCLQPMRQRLLSRIGDPDSYWLIVPIADDAIDVLLKDFEDRLAGSMDRIAARNARYKRATTQELRSNEDMVRAQILAEVTSPMNKIVMRRTTDPMRRSFDPESVAPGYSALSTRLKEISNELEKSHGVPTQPAADTGELAP